jgi:hypothetical protein
LTQLDCAISASSMERLIWHCSCFFNRTLNDYVNKRLDVNKWSLIAEMYHFAKRTTTLINLTLIEGELTVLAGFSEQLNYLMIINLFPISSQWIYSDFTLTLAQVQNGCTLPSLTINTH